VRILVTGGAGFIGSHLVDRLVAAGADVRILDSLDPQAHPERPDYLNPEAELIEGDVCDAQVVRHCLADVDRLVHLAAAVGVGQSMYEIVHYTTVNALGAAVVLEEAITRAAQLEKVVVASSMSIYGEGLYRCPREETTVVSEVRSAEQLAAGRWELQCPRCGEDLAPLPTPESKPLAPASIYAVGKRDHEEMFLAWGAAYGVPVTALRFFNVYGPRQALSNPYTGVAAIFGARLLNGRPPVVFEDGRQSRDFVHVSDIVEGIVVALEPGRGDGRAINLGTGRPVTVVEVAETLVAQLGVDVEPDVRNRFRAGDIRHCAADISLARELLGYEPGVAFADGMRELAAWMAGRPAGDLIEEATAQLVSRGLTSG
jgi:dTDP-L-rhamnose 4-epimerase